MPSRPPARFKSPGDCADMRDGAGEGALDLELLHRQTLGDRELEGELFSLFEIQAERLFEIIAGEGDPVSRAEAAHSLKGGAGAIGAVAVMRLAGELEILLRSGRSDQSSAVASLSEAIVEARQAIQGWRLAA